MLCALLAFPMQAIVMTAFIFTLPIKVEIAIAKEKLPPNDTPLSDPKGMLLKIYSGADSASNVFDISGVIMDPSFLKIECCHSGTAGS